MREADQLIQQAHQLASMDPRRPVRVNLRRAISAAYYALFHELTDAGAALIASQRTDRAVHREFVRRAYVHGQMRSVAEDTGRNASWLSEAGVPPGPALRDVARAFVELQQKRHSADYDMSRTFIRPETVEAIQLAESAITTWRAIRRTPEAEFFLVALLIGRGRRGQ